MFVCSALIARDRLTRAFYGGNIICFIYDNLNQLQNFVELQCYLVDPTRIYLLIVNNKNTRTRCEIC